MHRTGRSNAWERWLCRALVAAFLLGVGRWEWRAGLDVRQRAWAFSRSLRFDSDIANAVRWGNCVLRTAEALADGTGVPDPNDKAGAGFPVGHRRLTVPEIMRGEGQVYNGLLTSKAGGDFDLDYPPLRLLTMSLWVRAVQDRAPNVTQWPGEEPRVAASGGGRAGLVTSEDVAGPLLWINTVAAALTALLAFALVWLWVDRGGRRPALATVGRRRPPLARRTPLRRAHGLVLFPVASAAFAYALSVAVLPTPAPPPAVGVVGGRPRVDRPAGGRRPVARRVGPGRRGV
jgi:hypothetical protein